LVTIRGIDKEQAGAQALLGLSPAPKYEVKFGVNFGLSFCEPLSAFCPAEQHFSPEMLPALFMLFTSGVQLDRGGGD